MTKKGKGPEGSSSQRGEQQKRRRVILQDDETMQEEDELPRIPKPTWNSGSLEKQPIEWQADLFHEQMNGLRQRMEAFICEKEVRELDFGPFGVIDKFKALGWEAALRCHDKEGNNLYDQEIQEWVATLRCPPFKGASKMKLIGTVNGVDVEMSFDTLQKIAKFDTKPAKDYVFPALDDLYFHPEKNPNWQTMLNSLFRPGTNQKKLLRKDLTIEANLMLMICIHNIIPRRGDKIEVRYPEVPILYALLKGSPLIPFRFLVMNNIWISRNSVDRKIVPHCRLIAALLKKSGVIQQGAKGSYKKFKPFDVTRLGVGWEYKESDRYLKLEWGGQRWRALKSNARPLQPGEDDEPESEDDIPSGDDEYNDDVYVAPMHAGPFMEGSSMAGGGASAQFEYVGSAFDYARRDYDQDWALQGTMNQVIERMRPPVFNDWPSSAQLMFDHVTYMGASGERASKRNYDRNEQWNQTHAFAFQQEINDREEDDRRRRARDDFMAGRPVISYPPYAEYSTLPPYDGSSYCPVPPVHHSRWVDPNVGREGSAPGQSSGGAEQSSGSSGAFNFGEFSETMNSIFGPPQPPYY